MIDFDRTQLVLCVTHQAYLEQLGKASCVTWELGNELHYMLWKDLKGTAANVRPDELQSLQLDEDAAFNSAYENVYRRMGEINFGTVCSSSGKKEAVLIGPHWLASALLLDTSTFKHCCNELASEDLYAVVPERDTLIVYPKAASDTTKSIVRDLVANVEREARKPWGRRLFSYTPKGAEPVDGAI
jgi:hypothetical protein